MRTRRVRGTPAATSYLGPSRDAGAAPSRFSATSGGNSRAMGSSRTDILTPQQETYCQERAKGSTQRAAYRAAYPKSEKWKDSAVDSQACRLERRPKVYARLGELMAEAAGRAVVTREEILNAQGVLLRKALSTIEGNSLADKEMAPAVSALVNSSDRLMAWLPKDAPDDAPTFCRDFALLLAPPFLEPHRLIQSGEGGADYWLAGGRGSTKSSFCSLEVVKWIEEHPDQHAVVLMKRKADLRDAAYAQVVWAIRVLGLEEDYDMPESTLRITRRSTGQKIIFRGCDNANKIKSIKVPFGYVGIAWYEEADQFAGMAEIRKVNQSLTRGGADCVRLYSFNPPRSRMCWVNREMDARRAAGKPVYESTYLQVPPEWLGPQFLEDAEALREEDERAYRHEYLGEPVGMGTEVFDRVEFRELTDAEVRACANRRWGQDFGWYPDPWAVTGSDWRPGQRTLVTFCEDGGNKLTPADQAERLRALLTFADADGSEPEYHHETVWSDDADPMAIAGQRDAGIAARAAGKSSPGRMASYRFLQSVTWVIDPVRCPRLAAEVRAMEYETTADGEVLNSIPDGNDHWVDATRYACMREARDRSGFRKAA